MSTETSRSHADPTASYGLVVQPDAQVRRLCKQILGEEGLDSIAVEDGEAALSVIDKRGAPVIVVTELSLPRKDGFALLEELRRRFSPSQTKTVVVSAFAHLRGTASELQDKLGISWILMKESGDLFLRHALHQSLQGQILENPEPPGLERHADPARASRMDAMAVVDDGLPDEVLQSIVADTAEMFGVPVALVSLVLQDKQWFKAYFGLAGDLLKRRSTPVNQAFCRHVVDAGTTLVVPDAKTNPYFKSNPLVQAGIVGSYAGAPLITPAGDVLGTLCIIDNKPLGVDAKKVRGLEALARRVVGEIQLTLTQGKMAQQKKPSDVEAALSLLAHPLSGLDNGVILFGPDRRLLFANEAVEKILGIGAEKLRSMGRSDLLREIAEQTDDPVEFAIRLQMPRQGAFAFRGEFELQGRRPRRIRWVEEPIPMEGGTGQACFIRDVSTEIPRQPVGERPGEGPFAESGSFDRVSQTIIGEIARARQESKPITFVLFDLAMGKSVPGHEGIMARQRAYRQVADVLQGHAAATDVVMRWGPTEYLVAMPRTGAGRAHDFVDRVDLSIRKTRAPVVLRAGVAELGDREDFHLALARAGSQVNRQAKPVLA